MTRLLTIFGGSGFIGRYIARRAAKAGWRVRVAVRRPEEAIFVRTYGVVGQVEPVGCNLRDDASVRLALRHADAAVNCVGILAPQGKNTFRAVQIEGAERAARLAAEEGVERFVQVSAIGADERSASEYARTKARGESAVLEHRPRAVILRPSIVFGNEDEFFNRFGAMARSSPVLPIVGARTKFQPVYVDDVAAAAMRAIEAECAPGVYELGGPDVDTFRELMELMLQVIERKRLIVNVPFWAARGMGAGFDLLNRLSLGLISGPLTLDQVRNLAVDNVVSGRTKTFDDLGIRPISMEGVLPEYLWRFRPSGQYARSKASAKQLRGKRGGFG
ncbi:complex I NDUFA9 subunit family protein [Rhodovulum sp. 12E13]|uniref:complex I NDUFA9 subunit family protein n=1 Tax=Rhodovulum sp. 12E13 TaxID=2203891 RepID=UPI000E17C32C|nr:complex I NDUFA9 subunit family protein [Rhodovulum sp. 12E13]RDC72134.1 complex I NDUFA9 subunit family protein [Rhodovulum sp. 12E13]